MDLSGSKLDLLRSHVLWHQLWCRVRVCRGVPMVAYNPRGLLCREVPPVSSMSAALVFFLFFLFISSGGYGVGIWPSW